MVGAAKNEAFFQWAARSRHSSASKPPDFGTTFTPACSTYGRWYMPPPCESGAGCSMVSPALTLCTDAR